MKRFHQYLVGHRFTILSDHKPLQHLFQESRGIPTLASARIQRWALILEAYDYSIQYKPGPDHSNADMLSRLPLPESATDIPTPGENTLVLNMLESLPITSRDIRRWMDRDPVLSKVQLQLQKGQMRKPLSHTNTDTQYSACRMGVSSGVLESWCHRLVKIEFCANSTRDTQEYPV